MFVSYSTTSFSYWMPIPGDKIQSALLNSVKLLFFRRTVCFLVFVDYLFNALLFVGRCHFTGFDKDLRRGRKWLVSVFNTYVFVYFWLQVALLHNQLFVGRCHFKYFWSEGSRERERVSEAFIFCFKCVWSQCQREEKSTFWWELNGFWGC